MNIAFAWATALVQKAPCSMTVPLGLPVVPEVNMT